MKDCIVQYPTRTHMVLCMVLTTILWMGVRPGAAQDAETIDRIVAEVNDEIITLYELNQAARPFIERVRAMNRSLTEERRMLFDVREKVLNQLIDQKLTDQEIKRLKISVSDETVDRTIEQLKQDNYLTDSDLRTQLEREGMSMEEYRNQVRDQILRGRLVNREVKSKIVVTEEDIKACYMENQDKYCGEKKFHIRHIVLRVPPYAGADEKQEVRERMAQVLAKLDSGESFDEVARAHSESPLKDEGGDLGAFELKDLSPPIRKAVEGLEPGSHSSIVDTEQGLQVFYLERVIEDKGKSLDEARSEIEKQLYNEVVNKKFAAWLSDLRGNSHIKVIR